MKKRFVVLFWFLGIILFLLLLVGTGLLWLTSREYNPPLSETIAVSKELGKIPSRQEQIKLISWNIGYASLDASQDFFMDGGKGVRPNSRRIVEENLKAVQNFITASAADIYFLQEVDGLSKRSWENDQRIFLSEKWNGSSSFALNFLCPFVPVPFPDFIGKVESGLLNLNSFKSTAERISLPSSFSWPTRVAQLKRCLLIERIPAGNGIELVLINLHLEAYDEGGIGRTAQTKALADFVKAEYSKGNYVIAGGDFNQSFPHLNDIYPTEVNDFFTPGVVDASLFGDGWTFVGDPSAPTCRSLDKPYNGNRINHQFYIIDGFVLSPNIELISVKTHDLDFRNSDHNPVELIVYLR